MINFIKSLFKKSEAVIVGDDFNEGIAWVSRTVAAKRGIICVDHFRSTLEGFERGGSMSPDMIAGARFALAGIESVGRSYRNTIPQHSIIQL